MRLLEVNGISLLGASHQEAVNCLRSAGDVMHLLICDGYDAVEVERLQLEGKLARECKSTSESVSSLDRVDEESSFAFRPVTFQFSFSIHTDNSSLETTSMLNILIIDILVLIDILSISINRRLKIARNRKRGRPAFPSVLA